jgi:hypothetical protein
MNLCPSPFGQTAGFVFKDDSLLEQGATNTVSLGKILVFLGLCTRCNLLGNFVISQTTRQCGALKESLRFARQLRGLGAVLGLLTRHHG